jgi:hypothetical protein
MENYIHTWARRDFLVSKAVYANSEARELCILLPKDYALRAK